MNLVLLGHRYVRDRGSFTLTTGIMMDDPILQGASAAMANGLLTRAECTAMLVRAFYALDETATESFSDVHPPQWHHPYIASSEKSISSKVIQMARLSRIIRYPGKK